MFISNLRSPLFVFKRGFSGSLVIVFVKVIILVIAPLVHCWARGKHFFHLKELALLVVIKFWGVAWVFCFSVSFGIKRSLTDLVHACDELRVLTCLSNTVEAFFSSS